MQLLSVDGAMVPLVAGVWAEVKTLVLGTVNLVASEADSVVQTRELSYFSRLADVDTFSRLATVETQRRGTATARTVVAVVDGTTWCQGFIDYQRPDVVRILDFAHALEHLGQVAQVVYGAGTPAASEWLGQQAHALRHGDEQQVLERLLALGEAWRGQARTRTRQRRLARHAAQSESTPPVPPPAPPVTALSERPMRPKTIVNGKPTRQHPWRQTSPIAAKR